MLVRLCIWLFTNVSNSPVSTYFRWDLDNASVCCWVCMRVGMQPWYIVARFIRSMCMPSNRPFAGGCFVCGCLVLLYVGVGVLFLVPCTIGVGWCVSCLWLLVVVG